MVDHLEGVKLKCPTRKEWRGCLEKNEENEEEKPSEEGHGGGCFLRKWSEWRRGPRDVREANAKVFRAGRFME